MGLTSFRLLGPVEVRVEGRLVDVGHARQRLVLAALLVQANRVVAADRLVELLWGDDPPATSVDLVYGYVSRLRRRLGGAAGLVRVPGGYRLEADPESIDVHRFRRLVAAARSAGDDGRAAELLADGLGLWRGAALTGVAGQWAEGVRVALEAERVAAALDHGEVRLRLGGDGGPLGDLRGLLAGQPFDERVAGLFMRVAYRAGRRAEALECYHQLRGRLAQEVGVEPGPGLQDLFQRVLRDDPALGGPAGSSQPPQPVAAVPEVRYSLPPDTAAFTGRDAELSQITTAVAGAATAGGVVAVRAISGMPGAGKTALAVHAAHLLRQEFPSRQLFLNLHAHTPGQEPVRPEDALAGLLAATGTDPRFLPAGLDERSAMWRDKMAGQRALLVLDNAAGSGQVAPLLPGAAGCLVLITSRRHLGDLPGAVTPVLLGALPPGKAREMFTRLAPGATGSPEVAEVAELAGFLPLAISLLARVLARHPAWTLADLATETRAGLLTLAAENDSVAAAFDLSYRHLDPARQRLFGLLGLHPGATTDAYAAAALAGASPGQAAGLLDGLHAEGLLTEAGYRRYGMHDLLRRYARDHARADLGAAERDQALGRLLDYYQHAAALAQARLARQSRPGPPLAPPARSLAVPALDDAGQALAWARADRDNLLACLDHATRAGQHARVTALTAALAELLRRDGPWTEAITRHGTALKAARHLGDRPGQADALTRLGDLRRLTGDYPGATRDLQQALALYHDLSDRLGQATALTHLGAARWMTGNYPGATRDLEQALAFFRDLGDRLGQATALTRLGAARWMTGNYPGAARDLEQALAFFRDLGDQRGQAGALTDLGVVRRQTGDYPGAARDLEQALALYRDLSDRHGQAGALGYLGAVRRQTGDYPGAARDLEQALALCRDLGDRGGEAEVLNEIGTLHRASGELARAGQCHQEALELARTIASAWDEASALAGLARCAIAAGQPAHARALLRQAHEIFQRIGAAEAPSVLAELSALTSPDPRGKR